MIAQSCGSAVTGCLKILRGEYSAMGLEHAIYNTGMIDLRFSVVTSPPDE
jgi:hypothetical protein